MSPIQSILLGHRDGFWDNEWVRKDGSLSYLCDENTDEIVTYNNASYHIVL